MYNPDQINIDGNGNITLQNINGSTISIHKNDDKNTIIEKLNQLHNAQLDTLQQIIKLQTEKFSDLLNKSLKEIVTQKNIVLGSISHVGGNVHVGDNITYIINVVKKTTDPVLSDQYISLSSSGNVSIDILERRYLLKQFQALIDSGKRYIVLHGKDGIGKTTFLSIYYNAADTKQYQQKGWFDFQGQLPETYVMELTEDKFKTPSDITDWPQFYYRQALREVRKLNNLTIRNEISKRLIVIEGVSNEEGITAYFDDLLNMPNTVFVFISRQAFKDERFTNFSLPPLKEEEVRSILDKSFSKSVQDTYLPIINGNPFILSLILKQSPRDAEKKVQVFAAEVLKNRKEDIKEQDLQIVEALYNLSTLNPLETWLLLQFAALPNGRYDDLMLRQYWFSELDEDTIADSITLSDILDLHDYKIFSAQASPQQYEGTLESILENLSEKGWLDNKEDEYELNNLTRSVLAYHKQNQYAYTTEIANCLRINFFTTQHDNLKDHLVYEKHLRHYINFIQSVADPKYIDVLYKLITWCNELGLYYEELDLRKIHFPLVQHCYGINSDDAIEAETMLAWSYNMIGDLNTARDYAEKALQKAYKHLLGESSLTAKCESNLGNLLKDLGDYEGAKVLLEKVMYYTEKNLGENHPTTTKSYSNLALVLQDLGDYNRAKILLEKAMISDEKNFGENHPNTARSYSNLALVLQDLGDYNRAKELLEKAVNSDEKNLGKNHPSTATLYSNLALVLKDLGDYNRAKELLEKAVNSDEKSFGKNHPTTAIRYSNFARLLQNLGNYKEAFIFMSKALKVMTCQLGESHPNCKIVLNNLNLLINAMLKNGWTIEQIKELIKTQA